MEDTPQWFVGLSAWGLVGFFAIAAGLEEPAAPLLWWFCAVPVVLLAGLFACVFGAAVLAVLVGALRPH